MLREDFLFVLFLYGKLELVIEISKTFYSPSESNDLLHI
jgi:hypothetical protein